MPSRIGTALCLCVVVLAIGAERAPVVVKWSGKTVGGQEVAVPAADRATVVLFVRAEQPQSREAIRQLKSVAAEGAQVLLVISGTDAADKAKPLQEAAEVSWPIVADPDYSASGAMSVHVWPTTVVVNSAGQVTAHLPGLAKGYAADLGDHVAFAGGKIDRATLQERLQSRTVVADGPREKAGRHLQVAMGLLEKGRLEPAAAEVAEGLKLAPEDGLLQLAMSRVQLLQEKPAEALATLEKIKPGAVPEWQRATAKVRILIGLGQWDEAAAALPAAMKLNPNPAEAHYLAGLIHEHANESAKAAAAFRAAYEAAFPGQKAKGN